MERSRTVTKYLCKQAEKTPFLKRRLKNNKRKKPKIGMSKNKNVRSLNDDKNVKLDFVIRI